MDKEKKTLKDEYSEFIEAARRGKNLESMTIGEMKNYIRKLEKTVCDMDWVKEYLEILVNSAK